MPDIRELAMAIGYKKQAALQTALVAADCWRLHQNNRSIGQPNPVTESDKDDVGRGTPFATSLFKSHLDPGIPWEYFLTSENAAMLGVFGIGLTTKADAGDGYKYTCEASASFDVDMPATTIVQAMRQGASDIFDFGLIGCCLEEFSISLNSGPGRQNAQMRSSWIGCGKYASPSTIELPAMEAEHSLNAGGLTTCTVLGTNYLSNKGFVSAEFMWKNNIRADYGYFPGSGTQDGFQLRNRMRRGDPMCSLRLVVEAVDGGGELAAATALTEGTASIVVPGALISTGVYHKLEISIERGVFRAVQLADNDGIPVYQIDVELLEHSANGLMTYEVTTATDDIGTAAS
jgi:hypothetical protein